MPQGRGDIRADALGRAGFSVALFGAAHSAATVTPGECGRLKASGSAHGRGQAAIPLDKPFGFDDDDMGLMAAAMGYDGIEINGAGYLLLLNRTKLIIRRGTDSDVWTGDTL